MSTPTLAGAEKPGNQGRAKPESNNVEAIVVKPDGVQRIKARFVWAPPRIEGFCRAGAVQYLRSFWGNEPIPERDIVREQNMLLIGWALRRADDMNAQVYTWPANCFNSNTGEWNIAALRQAEIRDCCPNIDDLYNFYRAFAESEFPETWTPEQWRALVAEGKELSLATLLSRRGFLPILRALPGLAVHYAMSSPTTTYGGKP